MKISLQESNGRSEQTKERINKLEDRPIETIQAEEQKDKRMKTKNKQIVKGKWELNQNNTLEIVNQKKQKALMKELRNKKDIT